MDITLDSDDNVITNDIFDRFLETDTDEDDAKHPKKRKAYQRDVSPKLYTNAEIHDLVRSGMSRIVDLNVKAEEISSVRERPMRRPQRADTWLYSNVIKSIRSFPMLLHNAFNAGNIKDMQELCCQYFSPDIATSFVDPYSKLHRIDPRFITFMYESLLQSYPDATFLLQDMQTFSSDKFICLKCNIIFQGTKVFSQIEEMIGAQLPRITDLFDRTKMSNAEYLQWVALEDKMIQQKRNPTIYLNSEMTFILDRASNKIVRCFIKNHMMSFRIAKQVK